MISKDYLFLLEDTIKLFKVVETHESCIGNHSRFTKKTLAYFETKDSAQDYMRKNNLVWSGNCTGSVDYEIKIVNAVISENN